MSSQDLQTFYHLHEETRRKQGVPVQPWKFFEQLGKNVIDTGHGYIFLAYIEDRCIAGAIIFFFNKTVTYKFGASIQDERNLRPNQLILWRIIQWSCENNFTTLDFGKTDSENIGLRDFKRRWGAEEQPLFYSSLSSKSNNAKKGHKSLILEWIIKKSPVWVGRLIGELLYKHFA